jgi:hypothetical protein
MAMRRIRYLALAALGVFAALPVAHVYTSGAPWVEKMEIRNNDLVGLQGRGVPGTQIGVFYRQRNFKQGCYCDADIACAVACVVGGAVFEWCGWLFNGGAIFLGSTVVSGAGTWRLQELDTQVLPGTAAGRTCATGVLTQIELQSQYGNVSVPNVKGLDMLDSDAAHQLVGAGIEFANQVAIGVADGPNDVQDAVAPWTIDTDDDGADLCVNGIGCGAPVSWKLRGSPGTFQPPSIQVRDDSPVIGPRDQEFSHVMGMIQGHKPGGSVLAVAYVPRPAPLGPVINVNVDVKGLEDLGGCSSSSRFFDFFP